MNKAHLVSAAALARMCGVDLKTVHNWLNNGQGPANSFRTPGGHLRIPAVDVASWMLRRKFPVPDELKPFLPADEKLARDVDEMTALLGKMSFVERGEVLERARGIVATKTGGVYRFARRGSQEAGKTRRSLIFSSCLPGFLFKSIHDQDGSSGVSKHLLLTKYDISRSNHERWPGIMARFVESFPGPIVIGGEFVGGDAGPDGRPTVGHVVSVEERGEDLWGEIVWLGDPPPSTRHIRMSWSFGPGPDRVSLTSGFLDNWPHRTAWDEDETDEGPDPNDEEDLMCIPDEDDWI